MIRPGQLVVHVLLLHAPVVSLVNAHNTNKCELPWYNCNLQKRKLLIIKTLDFAPFYEANLYP